MNTRVTTCEETSDVLSEHATGEMVSACSIQMQVESAFKKEDDHGRQQ